VVALTVVWWFLVVSLLEGGRGGVKCEVGDSDFVSKKTTMLQTSKVFIKSSYLSKTGNIPFLHVNRRQSLVEPELEGPAVAATKTNTTEREYECVGNGERRLVRSRKCGPRARRPLGVVYHVQGLVEVSGISWSFVSSEILGFE
jgi:hypothetical protein